MRHIFAAGIMALAISGLASCGEKKFHVTGSISGAADSLLYFENMSLQGPVAVDSVRLTADGGFDFSDARPDAPEFYRLRIDGQIINLSIDSTETVTVRARYADMATGYEVDGSADCSRIRELSLMQIDLQRRVESLGRDATLTIEQAHDSLVMLLRAYKDKVTAGYIFKAPNAASSYFALFQTLGDYLIFNPRTDRDDIRVFAAVATSWDTFHPGALRGENLHNIAVEGMRNERIVAAGNNSYIDPAKISTAGLIDISLTDNRGHLRSLTGLKGRVVMLDFHVFGTKESPARILTLRELYNKYHAEGFEIYQVALDADEHFWKQQTEALPWICVRDADGLGSNRLAVYNIRSLPEFFLIDRGNNLVSRSTQIKDLDEAISALLARQ